MKITILLTIFFITIQIIFSINLTKFYKPQHFVFVDAIVRLMENSYILNHAKGVSVSTTSSSYKDLLKRDIISKLFQQLETQIKYRFHDDDRTFTDVPRYHNVVLLKDYDDFRSV